MAGGKGLRLKSEIEKPLYPLNDKPLMSYVLDNIKDSNLIEKTVVAVSPNAPNTKEYLINDLNFSNFDESFYDSPSVFYLLEKYFSVFCRMPHQKNLFLFANSTINSSLNGKVFNNASKILEIEQKILEINNKLVDYGKKK